MDFDWKQAVKAIAPTIAGVAGGPLAAGAVKVLADNLLGGSSGDPVQDEAQIAGILANGITPEIRAKLIEADNTLKQAVIAAGVREKEIDADLDKATLADVADARKTHASDQGVFWLGISVLLIFAVMLGLVLIGCFALLTGGMAPKDIAVVATVSSLIGTVVGYVAANAQQVVSYYFGSSRGSHDKTNAMASAVASIGKR